MSGHLSGSDQKRGEGSPLRLCQEATKTEQTVGGVFGTLLGPTCGLRFNASYFLGLWTLLYSGLPFPLLISSMGPGMQQVPAEPPSCASRNSWSGAPSQGAGSEADCLCPLGPHPTGTGGLAREVFCRWVLGVTLSMFGAVVASVTHW